MSNEPMQAGRELDALIAERIFGWRWMAYPAPNNPTETRLTALFPPAAPDRIVVANRYDRIWRPSDSAAPRFSNWDTCAWWEDGDLRRGFPRYSTDIAAAWQFVEAMERRGFWLHALEGKWENLYRCIFSGRAPNGGTPYYQEMAPTAPLAICLAALRAVGEP